MNVAHPGKKRSMSAVPRTVVLLVILLRTSFAHVLLFYCLLDQWFSTFIWTATHFVTPPEHHVIHYTTPLKYEPVDH